MFTGVNCSAAIGRHCEVSRQELRKIKKTTILFMEIAQTQQARALSDAYLVDDAARLAARPIQSVTTVMALTVPESISLAERSDV